MAGKKSAKTGESAVPATPAPRTSGRNKTPSKKAASAAKETPAVSEPAASVAKPAASKKRKTAAGVTPTPFGEMSQEEVMKAYKQTFGSNLILDTVGDDEDSDEEMSPPEPTEEDKELEEAAIALAESESRFALAQHKAGKPVAKAAKKTPKSIPKEDDMGERARRAQEVRAKTLAAAKAKTWAAPEASDGDSDGDVEPQELVVATAPVAYEQVATVPRKRRPLSFWTGSGKSPDAELLGSPLLYHGEKII